MLQNISRRGTLRRIVAEHPLEQFERRRGDQVLVLLLKNVGAAICRAQQLEPRHLDNVRPVILGRGTQNGVDLVKLVDFAAVAGEDGSLGEYLH